MVISGDKYPVDGPDYYYMYNNFPDSAETFEEYLIRIQKENTEGDENTEEDTENANSN